MPPGPHHPAGTRGDIQAVTHGELAGRVARNDSDEAESCYNYQTKFYHGRVRVPGPVPGRPGPDSLLIPVSHAGEVTSCFKVVDHSTDSEACAGPRLGPAQARAVEILAHDSTRDSDPVASHALAAAIGVTVTHWQALRLAAIMIGAAAARQTRAKSLSKMLRKVENEGSH